MNRLEYINLCIKESLRLYPPVFAVGRKMSKDVTFDGHVMPEGMFNSGGIMCDNLADKNCVYLKIVIL